MVKVYKTKGLTQDLALAFNSKLEDITIILRVDDAGATITLGSKQKAINISANCDEFLEDLRKEAYNE